MDCSTGDGIGRRLATCCVSAWACWRGATRAGSAGVLCRVRNLYVAQLLAQHGVAQHGVAQHGVVRCGAGGAAQRVRREQHVERCDRQQRQAPPEEQTYAMRPLPQHPSPTQAVSASQGDALATQFFFKFDRIFRSGEVTSARGRGHTADAAIASEQSARPHANRTVYDIESRRRHKQRLQGSHLQLVH